MVPGERDATRELGEHGCIYTLAAPRAPAFDRRYRLLYPHRYLPLIGRRLIRLVAREQPDVIEICDKFSLPYLAALLRKRLLRGVKRPPVLAGSSCERFDDNMASYVHDGRLARAFTRWYIRNIYGPPFDIHLANSTYTALELNEALHDRSPGFVRVCPMGVEIDAFGPERRSDAARDYFRTGLNLDASGRLLYAGRLSPDKNLGLLVETRAA